MRNRKRDDAGREVREVERAKCHPNFLTSEVGIMEGRRGWMEVVKGAG